jgi:hypothetical protein
MSSVLQATIPLRRRTSLRAVFAVCGLTLGWVAADVVYGTLVEGSRLRVLTAYLLPAFAGAVLLSVWRFGRQGPGPVSRTAFATGGLFLCLAAGIDLCVTLRSDPNLTLEANPYIRALLDGTTLAPPAVLALVILTQSLFVATFVTAWWAFLRHRPTILASIRSAAPQTWPAFFKAATGGACLTYRAWLLPLRPGEIPDPYHSVWPAALAVCFGTSLFRLWAAGEWLDLVPAEPVLRAVVLLLGVGGTLLAYFAWLAASWRRGSPAADRTEDCIAIP